MGNRARFAPISLGDRDEDQCTKCFKRKSPEIIPGTVSSETAIKTGADEMIVAIITRELTESFGLRAGWEVQICFEIVRRNKKAGACAGFFILVAN
jgi:molybdopterin-binding protein